MSFLPSFYSDDVMPIRTALMVISSSGATAWKSRHIHAVSSQVGDMGMELDMDMDILDKPEMDLRRC